MATQPVETTDEAPSRAVVPMTAQRESYAILKDKAKMFSLSPLIPDHLRNGGPDVAAANCLIALQMAEAMGEMPLVVMQNIHVVKGKAGFAAQYMIARANSSGIFKGRISWDVDKTDPANLSVTAYAYLADTGERIEFTCDMKMAQAESWTSNGKYKSMPEVMLRYRSATFLVRFYAPDVMLGYQTAEEVEDVNFAAAPAEPTLTGKMLIEQSQPAPADEASVNKDDQAPATEEPAKPADAPTETIEDATVEDVADERSPGRIAADRIIAEVKKAGAIIDISSIESRSKIDLEAMDPGDAETVRTVIAARKAEITATREKEGAQ